ncbi:MAG: arsenate reductase ArsC, partial [Euryarchaeota archaeon]|nr:arsenate reductase ArsC [Euryarchaeota archaeon]
SRHKPKPFDMDVATKAWRVIAMCSLGACPVDVAEKTEHWGVPDPADVQEERWHEIRNEIADRVRDLLDEIAESGVA